MGKVAQKKHDDEGFEVKRGGGRDEPRTLTRRQQNTIRSNLARRATQLGNRLVANALGELPDEMTPGQVRSALGVLQHLLPSMVQQEVVDMTEERMTRDQLLARQAELRKQILRTVTPEELQGLMAPVAVQRKGESGVEGTPSLTLSPPETPKTSRSN